jgi:hypothetical protein
MRSDGINDMLEKAITVRKKEPMAQRSDYCYYPSISLTSTTMTTRKSTFQI